MRPLARDVLMSDFIILLLAAHDASSAAVNVHGLEELFLAVHALELNVSVTAGRGVVLFVLVARLEDQLRLTLDLLDLLLDFDDFGVTIRDCTLGFLNLLQALVQLLLVHEQLAHSPHILEIAKIGQAKANVPDIVLVDVYVASDWVIILSYFTRADILGPGVVDSRQVFEGLDVRFLSHHDRVVIRLHRALVDLRLRRRLERLETEHGAPEDENDDQVEENHDEPDQTLRHLPICVPNRDA